MEKIIFAFLLVSVIACNNSADKSTPATHSDSSVAKPAAPTDKVTDVGTCGNLVFFKEGAQIVAASYNAKGEETSKQTTKVLAIKMEDGMTVAEVEGVDEVIGEESKTVHYNYKCDGNNIYFDVASMFRTDEKNQDGTFESSLISYPINITDGQTLPDVTGTMKSERNGKKMEMEYHYKERKVEGKEEVTTPAGTFNCFKISNTVQVDMNIPGMDEKAIAMMKKMQEGMKTTSITWFAPDFGIVKMEMYMNGELKSRNEVISVKK
jgi:hypothetical protein